MADDLRAELDRLEVLRASRRRADTLAFEDLVHITFPAIAAELRRLWAAEDDRSDYPSLLADRDSIMRMLESLTPGGSEYHNDPRRCTEYVQAECDRLREEVASLHAQLQRQAYVVPEGAQLVVPPHVAEVGYVLVRGGRVVTQGVTP